MSSLLHHPCVARGPLRCGQGHWGAALQIHCIVIQIGCCGYTYLQPPAPQPAGSSAQTSALVLTGTTLTKFTNGSHTNKSKGLILRPCPVGTHYSSPHSSWPLLATHILLSTSALSCTSVMLTLFWESSSSPMVFNTTHKPACQSPA